MVGGNACDTSMRSGLISSEAMRKGRCVCVGVCNHSTMVGRDRLTPELTGQAVYPVSEFQDGQETLPQRLR